MKLVIFLLLLTSTAMAECLKDSKGARSVHESIWDTSEATSLDIEKIKIAEHDGFKVTTNDSCGVQGCETTIVVADNNGCLKAALEFEGRPVSKDRWKTITITDKNLAVDGPTKDKTSIYKFDPETMTYKK